MQTFWLIYYQYTVYAMYKTHWLFVIAAPQPNLNINTAPPTIINSIEVKVINSNIDKFVAGDFVENTGCQGKLP